MTDFVVPYVNCADQEWFQAYAKESRKAGRQVVNNSERFRDYGTLLFLLRGVKRFMPWVRNIYLLVERPSQVPSYVTSDIKVIYHHDIMPGRFLPTYNSTSFEMYLHRIPGLSEKFIYANDDMIPVAPLSPEDFYDGDLPRLHHRRTTFNPENTYQCNMHNNEALALRIIKNSQLIPNNPEKQSDPESPENPEAPSFRKTIIRTGHTISPLLRSTWEHLWDIAGSEIEASITQFRDSRNLNQDLAAIWHILSGNYAESHRRTTYYDMRQIQRLRWDLMEGKNQVICINDSHSRNYHHDATAVRGALLTVLPPE